MQVRKRADGPDSGARLVEEVDAGPVTCVVGGATVLRERSLDRGSDDSRDVGCQASSRVALLGHDPFVVRVLQRNFGQVVEVAVAGIDVPDRVLVSSDRETHRIGPSHTGTV